MRDCTRSERTLPTIIKKFKKKDVTSDNVVSVTAIIRKLRNCTIHSPEPENSIPLSAFQLNLAKNLNEVTVIIKWEKRWKKNNANHGILDLYETKFHHVRPHQF